jgi:uncharacterized repeat protein (TIGR01451 family)
MGRRIIQLVGLMLTTGLGVPLALALAEPPEPTPAAPAAAPKKDAADDDLPPLEPVEAPAPPAVPAPPAQQAKDLLRKVLGGDASQAKPGATPLPGPKSLAIPPAKAADAPAQGASAGQPAKADDRVTLVEGAGERPAPPPAEKEPGGAPPPASDVTPLPRTPRPGDTPGEPGTLPFVPQDARDLPSAKAADDGAPAADPALDAQLHQSQAPAETNPLPPAIDRGGKPGAPAAGPAAEGLESFVLPAEQLPLGRQAVGLTVEVVSPQFLNRNQEASLKIVVKNTGSTDARGVVVRDELPAALQFQSSQPIAQNSPGSRLYVWALGTVPAGSERIILLRVVPKHVGAFEHAATVSMQSGGKARTLVREPKLKVEQTVSSAKVLKGQPVEWGIAVTNTGDGPARRVLVRAKLSRGLRHESGEPNEENLFEQELDSLEPGQRVALDALVTDTIAGGAQTCTVEATSPDVAVAAPESRNTQTVNVVEPKLAMTVVGPEKRFTDTVARYDVTVANTGTATARKLRVLASLPVSGRLTAVPAGAQFDKATRKLSWSLVQLDPNEKATFSFQVQMGGAGSYQVAVDARADGGLHAEGSKSTIVEGLADLDLEVTEKRRVVDVGDTAVFSIKITNRGTKEATQVLVSGFLSKNLAAREVDIENNGEVGYSEATGEIRFPKIDRVGPGKSTTVNVKVQALPSPGLATFRVQLVHDDLKEGKLEDIGSFRITPARTADK